MRKQAYILYVFAYVLDIFAAFPYPIMDSTTVGRRPKAAGPLLWRRPEAASIMVDGEVANIGKTYANMYRIFMYMYISHILIYFPYVIPGAISLAKSGCLKHQNDQIHVKKIQERHFPEKKSPCGRPHNGYGIFIHKIQNSKIHNPKIQKSPQNTIF